MDKPPLLLPLSQLLSASGRINRLQYLAQWGLYVAILLPIALIIYLVLDSLSYTHSVALLVGTGGLTYLLTYLFVCLHAKRLHDLGMPAIISAVLVVAAPLAYISALISHFTEVPEAWRVFADTVTEISKDANIGMGAYLLMAPGQPGANKYGADPLAVLKAEQD